VSYVVVLGFGGSVKGLLGSIGVDGIYGWLEHGLFLLAKMRVVADGKDRMVIYLGGVVMANVMANHRAAIKETLVKIGF